MSAIRFKGKWVRIGEAWFGEDAGDLSGLDILQLLQAPTVPRGFGNVERFETLISDLALPEDALFQLIRKNSRYKIRRAEDRDLVKVDFYEQPSPSVAQEFGEFFLRFANFKGLGDIRGKRLDAYRDSGRLWLSRTLSPNGISLGWHAYLSGDSASGEPRVRLLYSASARGDHADLGFRNLVGRANRLHHWRDMIRYKSLGVRCYDLGGWYSGNSDSEKLNINNFKESFGGTHETSWHSTRALTLKGLAYLTARKLQATARNLRKSG
jgi:hypothetical protein